jgi:hypothetical protein
MPNPYTYLNSKPPTASRMEIKWRKIVSRQLFHWPNVVALFIPHLKFMADFVLPGITVL